MIFACILIPLSAIIIIKELFRVMESGDMRRRMAKWIQWIVLILIAFNLYPVFFGVGKEISTLQYAAAAVSQIYP